VPTFSIHTLGCRANQADSELLREILVGAGFVEVPFGQPADCQIVNTCTVTREADRKARQLLNRALRLGGTVVATGCAVAARGGLRQLPGAVLRLPFEKREKILELLGAGGCPSQDLVDGEVRQARARALLKVQDGCDQFCTFCIVPYIRGRSRSLPVAELVERARRLEEQGYGEIVLSGIHLAVWGRDLPGSPDLGLLLDELCAATRSVRFRLSSIEPRHFPRGLFDRMAARPRRLCPHLHLALQHASDRVLERMRRGYDRAHYDSLVAEFLDRVPGACLTSDILVGFPGETDQDFRELLDYVRRTPFYRLHVFPYSPRPGTAAARFADQVPPEVKKARMEAMLALARRKRLEYLRRFYGARREVLVEHPGERPGEMVGVTDNYLPVLVRGGPALLGRRVLVELGRRRGEMLTGRLAGQEICG
jgi:threonylcarbamoyladenosine tRNA methylthiotransferase MtaB